MSGITPDRFHATDEKYLEYARNSLQNGVTEGWITEDDATLISDYVSELYSTCSMGAGRVFKLHSVMTKWRKYIGPYRQNTIFDIYTGINNLKNAKKPDGTPMTSHTKSDYVKFLKRFYLWMIDNGYSSIPEKKLNAIHPPAVNEMSITAEMLLSYDEVKRMIGACKISRDRAFIALLYEGGFRVSELGKLRWNQVQFNQWNVIINVNNKTGKARRIPLVMARPYLAQWMNDYYFDPTGDAFVFLTTTKHEPLQYRGVAKQIGVLAQRAKIEKPVKPHIFRHSRITHLIKEGYSESVIKKMMWGNLTTKMFAVYAHLTDADIDNEIARKQGIITEEQKKEKILEARQCSRCYTVNGPTQNFCSTCGLALTLEANKQSQDLVQTINQIPPEKIIQILSQMYNQNIPSPVP